MSKQISAFPHTEYYASTMERDGVEAHHFGMTLRDWFAGQALAGLLATYTTDEVAWEKVALRAYGLADAMIAERSKS